jgi:menaquinone-dependent protoporphyrinogen oxidase
MPPQTLQELGRKFKMARILLIFDTLDGQTARIAERITAILSAKGYTLDVHNACAIPRELPLRTYEGFVIGSTVQNGKHHKNIVKFIKRHWALMQKTPGAFFSVSLSAGSSFPKIHSKICRYFERFVKQTGWKPQKVAFFGGSLPYSRYGYFQRLLKRYSSRNYVGPTDIHCDYEFTDWAEVERFVDTYINLFSKPKQSALV